MSKQLLGLLMAGLVALAGGEASAARATPEPRCRALTGDRALRKHNARQRQRNLYWVHETKEGVTIAHANGDWEEPRPLSIEGLTLLPGRSGETTVQLSDELARTMGCAPGRYQLRIDDALGRGLRVLALMRGKVLVEQRGRLRYLTADGLVTRAGPGWLMAWGSAFKVRAAPHSPRRRPVIRLGNRRYPPR